MAWPSGYGVATTWPQTGSGLCGPCCGGRVTEGEWRKKKRERNGALDGELGLCVCVCVCCLLNLTKSNTANCH